MITQTINLNLIPGGVLPRINVSQYDKGSRTLNFNIYNGSVLFNIPSGSTVTIQGTKPDHTGFQYSCEYEGAVVTADLEQQMSVISGEVTCEITINKNLELIGTGNFILNVEPAAVKDDTVISETELPLIEQAIEAAAEAEVSAASAAESAAEAASWSAHPPYIGGNGNWYVYDPETEEFVDTGDPSRGPQGIQGETGPKGDTGVTPDITMNASVDNTSGTPAVVVTETGTDEDPIFSLAFSGLKGPQGDTGATGETGPQGPTGPTGNGISNITKTGTSGLVDAYTITYTDGTTSTFTVTNGRDGTGSGDMSMSDYDPTGSVKNDGGIPDFIADQISGKQNMILASTLPIGGTIQTTVEGALRALNNAKQNIILSSALTIGGQQITEVEPALRALNEKGGGHTIVGESGTELPQRSKLQFEGAIVSDDSTNDKTVVETVNPVDYEEDIYGVNLIPYPYYETTETSTDVTFTDNKDGSITVSSNGNTIASTREFTISRRYGYEGNNFFVKNGEYKICGGVSSRVYLVAYSTQNGAYAKYVDNEGGDTEFTVDGDDSSNEGAYVGIAIHVTAGEAISPITIYPMLRKATIQDDTYRPYNQQSIQHQLTEQTNVLGAKNLVHSGSVALTKTVNGITYAVNSDGSVLINGTASNNADFDLDREIPLIAGNSYIYNFAHQDRDDIRISIYRYGMEPYYQESGWGKDTIYTAKVTGNHCMYLRVISGKTVNNVTVYPMLRLASDPDDTYVPYAMTNRELTEVKPGTITAQSNNYATYQSNCYMYKSGKVVNLFMFIDVSQVTSDNTYITIATLSEKPRTNHPMLLPEWNDRSKAIQAQIPDERVQIRPKVTGTFILQTTFITA